MAKPKQQEEASHKAHKQAKKSKSPKSSSKGFPSLASAAIENIESSKSAAASLAAKSKLNSKQTELARVYHLKCALLFHGDLSYLEYQELREEIGRLNTLKETLASQIKI